MEIKSKEIQNFADKLGETFFDAIMEDDNTSYEMAKGIINAFNSCSDEKEFQAANNMLIGCCGYSIESLIDRIKERDSRNFPWESC